MKNNTLRKDSQTNLNIGGGSARQPQHVLSILQAGNWIIKWPNQELTCHWPGNCINIYNIGIAIAIAANSYLSRKIVPNTGIKINLEPKCWVHFFAEGENFNLQALRCSKETSLIILIEMAEACWVERTFTLEVTFPQKRETSVEAKPSQGPRQPKMSVRRASKNQGRMPSSVSVIACGHLPPAYLLSSWLRADLKSWKTCGFITSFVVAIEATTT